MDEVDIIQGTLGKAVGVVGGYIAAKKDVIDFIRLVILAITRASYLEIWWRRLRSNYHPGQTISF